MLPLFPQYSSAATGSAIERVYQVLGAEWNVTPTTTVGAFYDHPGFIASFTEVAKKQLDAFRPDFVLFSYHGLPERHMRKSDLGGKHCLQRPDCCDAIVPANRYCYRAQCFATTRALAFTLGLGADDHTSPSSRAWAAPPGSTPTPTWCSPSWPRPAASGWR